MNLHVDIPTRAQIDLLLDARDPASVSIYVATAPASSGDAERIELRNLAAEAVRQLEEAAVRRPDVAAIEESVAAISDDEAFWRYQARSLALFVTPAASSAFRLPNQLVSQVQVSRLLARIHRDLRYRLTGRSEATRPAARAV